MDTMNDRFYLELAAGLLERKLLNALWRDPYDTATLGAYQDFLVEQDGRDTALAMLRDGVIPGYGRKHQWEKSHCKVCHLTKTVKVPCPGFSGFLHPHITSGAIGAHFFTNWSG